MPPRVHKLVITAWLALLVLPLANALWHFNLYRVTAMELDPYGLFTLIDLLLLGLPIVLFVSFLRVVRGRDRAVRERELLSGTLQSITEAAIVVDSQRRIRHINAAAFALSGWAAEEASLRPVGAVLRIVIGDSPFDLEAAVDKAVQGQPAAVPAADAALIDREGTRHPVEGSLATITIPGESQNGVVITLRDISEWTAFQDDLALAHAAIEKSGTPFYKVSPYGQILDINDSACRLFSYRREELVGNHISTLDPDKTPRVLDEYWDTLRAGGTLISETQLLQRDGTPIDVETTSNYIVFNGREMDFSFIKDVTQLKERARKNRFLTQIYSILFHTNQALLQCRTEAELFARICQIVVADGGAALGWVGTADAESGVIRVQASFGEGREYLDGIKVSSRPDVPEGRGPSGMAFREGRPIVVQDFLADPLTAAWWERAERFGWKASASIGIRRGGGSYAVFSFYHYEVHAFTDPIVELLAEMARNIGHALDRFDLEEQRNQAEARLRVAAKVFDSDEAMFVLDADRHIVKVNEGFTRATGFGADELIGRPTPFLGPGGPNGAANAPWNEIARLGSWQGEIEALRKQGSAYTTWVHISAVKDEGGAVTHYVGRFTDLTEHQAAQARIRHLANFDQLTQLPNRRMLIEHLDQTLKDVIDQSRAGALLHLDLDRFKNLNDSQGHEYGDLLLQECARRIQGAVGKEDVVARIGGDEFAVFLAPHPDDRDTRGRAEAAAARLLEAVGSPYHIHGDSYPGSVSIGVAIYRTAADAPALLRRADLAMHEAKRAGRNTVRFFDPVMQEKLDRRAQLETDLHYACEGGQLHLHFQPQVDPSGKVVGAEALLRWRHPRLGWISPTEFIPIAEDTGAIVIVGRWVLDNCCRQLKAWGRRDATRHLALAMNVSAREFQSNGFIDSVHSILKCTGVNPGLLVVELTESMLLQDMADSIGKMKALKRLGLQIALDDFGTGYSSLAHLKRLPVDQLKIDQTFIKDLGTSKGDDAIVKAIIQMGSTLGKVIVAEGVENARQRDILTHYGCHNFQGFLFGRPMARARFEQGLQPEGHGAEQPA